MGLRTMVYQQSSRSSAAARTNDSTAPPTIETIEVPGVGFVLIMALAGSLQSVAGYGVGNFMPSFIIRAHDMAIGDIGWRLALITGLGGAIAIVTSGFITDRLAARSPGCSRPSGWDWAAGWAAAGAGIGRAG